MQESEECVCHHPLVIHSDRQNSQVVFSLRMNDHAKQNTDTLAYQRRRLLAEALKAGYLAKQRQEGATSARYCSERLRPSWRDRRPWSWARKKPGAVPRPLRSAAHVDRQTGGASEDAGRVGE